MSNKKGIALFLLVLLISIIASGIFTFADFIIHKSVGEIGNVNKGYFINKFLFSIIGFWLGFSLLRFIPIWLYAILFGLILQLRYIYADYSLKFHIIFIPIHIILIFIILAIGRLI